MILVECSTVVVIRVIFVISAIACLVAVNRLVVRGILPGSRCGRIVLRDFRIYDVGILRVFALFLVLKAFNKSQALLFFFKGFPLRGFTFQPPRHPYAQFVKQHHGARQQRHGEDIGCRRDDCREDEHGNDGVGTRGAHHLRVEEVELDQGHDDHRELEAQPEYQAEHGHEGDGIFEPQFSGDIDTSIEFLEEFQRPRDDDEVGKQHAGGKQQETGDDDRDNEFLLFLIEAGDDKFANKVEDDREGEDQAGIQTDLEDAHETLEGTEHQ